MSTKAESDEGFTLADWKNARPEVYERFKEYEVEIKPLMLAFRDKCVELGFPVLAVVAHTQQADGTCAVAFAAELINVNKCPGAMLAASFAAQTEPMYAMRAAMADSERQGRLADEADQTKH